MPTSSKLKFKARNLLTKLKLLANQKHTPENRNERKVKKHARLNLWLIRGGDAPNVIR